MIHEPNKERSIVHFDLDTFFVSVERLLNSKLNNIPVLVGGLSDRGVVASCSYEARNFGINSGMSMKIARRLCPKPLL
jgi:DNA polymerase-4